MAEMEQVFKALSDGLKSLSQAISGMAERVDQMSDQEAEEVKPAKAKAKPAAKAKAKRKAPVKKAPKKKAVKAKSTAKKVKKAAKPAKIKTPAKKQTAIVVLEKLIAKYPDGVDTDELKKKTGFDDKKIHNIVYKLKKQGTIKTTRKGIYVST